MNKMKNEPEQEHNLFKELTLRTVIDEIERYPFSSREMIGYYLTFFFAFFSKEMIYAFFFNSKNKLVGRFLIQEGEFPVLEPVSEIFDRIEETAYELNAVWFILAHNHIGTPPVPSANDTLLTAKYKKRFSDAIPILKEHFIVSGSDYTTMFSETLWKKRYDGGRITLFE